MRRPQFGTSPSTSYTPAMFPQTLLRLRSIPTFSRSPLLFKLPSVHWRFNSTVAGPPTTVLTKGKPTKNKTTIQKLRRRPDQTFQNESTSYILLLLNENNNTASLEKYLSPVSSVTVGESIDFEALLAGLAGFEYKIIIPDEVINVKLREKDLMVLSNGSVVGWDISEDDICQYFIPILEPAIVEKYESFESEEVDWIDLKVLPKNPLNNGNSYLQGEVMVVQGATDDKKMLDRAAFAIGLSRSTRLSILETSFEEHLVLTKKNSEHLAKGFKITTSESDILKLTGRLFLLRGKLNLYSELIETPDLYWSEPTLERIYNSVSKTLDINSRIAILNRKLDYATEEQRAFLSVLNEKKGTRLEWIIIILIMVEVCFETFHFYEKQSHHE